MSKITNFKDMKVQYPNRYTVTETSGTKVDKTIDFNPGTIFEQGTPERAEYFNEIQKNSIYEVKGTRVVEGQNEIYDIAIDGSDTFVFDNIKLLLSVNETNIKQGSVLRFNGNLFSLKNSIEVITENYLNSNEKYFINLDFNKKTAEIVGVSYSENLNLLKGKMNIENTIEDLKKSKKYKLGDVVEVLGFRAKGDGAHHKRIAKSEDDGSGEQGQNGIWWCIVHDGEVNVSWFGVSKINTSSKNGELFQKAIDFTNQKLFIDVDFTTTTVYISRKPHTYIEGIQRRTITLDALNSDVLFNVENGLSHSVINNLVFSSNVGGKGVGIFNEGSESFYKVFINNCYFSGLEKGIYTSTVIFVLEKCSFLSCTIGTEIITYKTQPFSTLFKANDTHYFYCETGCKFTSIDNKTPLVLVELNFTTFEHCSTALILDKECFNVNISNCWFEANSNPTQLIATSRNIIVNTRFETSDAGIEWLDSPISGWEKGRGGFVEINPGGITANSIKRQVLEPSAKIAKTIDTKFVLPQGGYLHNEVSFEENDELCSVKTVASKNANAPFKAYTQQMIFWIFTNRSGVTSLRIDRSPSDLNVAFTKIDVGKYQLDFGTVNLGNAIVHATSYGFKDATGGNVRVKLEHYDKATWWDYGTVSRIVLHVYDTNGVLTDSNVGITMLIDEMINVKALAEKEGIYEEYLEYVKNSNDTIEKGVKKYLNISEELKLFLKKINNE